MIATWRRGNGNGSEIYYAIGIAKSGGGYEWSEPVALTADSVYDNAPTTVVTNSGQALVVYQKSDHDIVDDTDLYYSTVDVTTSSLAWPQVLLLLDEATGNLVLVDTQTISIGYKFQQGGSVPNWVPIVGGNNKFKIIGEFKGERDCSLTLSGTLIAEAEIFGGQGTGKGTASGSAKWVTDKKVCAYVFDEAALTVAMELSMDIPGWKFAIPLIVDLEAGITVGGGVEGKLFWKATNFPGWPSGGEVNLLVSLGPYGKASLLGDTIEGKISGTGGAKIQLAPTFDVVEISMKLAADAETWCCTFHWDKTWKLPSGFSNAAVVTD